MTSTGFRFPSHAPRAVGYVRVPRVVRPVLRGVMPPGTVGTRTGRYTSSRPFLVSGAGYGGLVGTAAAVAAADKIQYTYAIAELIGSRPDEIAVVENAARAWDMPPADVPEWSYQTLLATEAVSVFLAEALVCHHLGEQRLFHRVDAVRVVASALADAARQRKAQVTMTLNMSGTQVLPHVQEALRRGAGSARRCTTP